MERVTRISIEQVLNSARKIFHKGCQTDVLTTTLLCVYLFQVLPGGVAESDGGAGEGLVPEPTHQVAQATLGAATRSARQHRPAPVARRGQRGRGGGRHGHRGLGRATTGRQWVTDGGAGWGIGKGRWMGDMFVSERCRLLSNKKCSVLC